MSKATKIEPLLTTAEVAEILRSSQDHVVSLYRAGKLLAAVVAVKAPASGRPGPRMLRFRPEDVQAYIEAQMTVCEPPSAAETKSPGAPAVVPVLGGESLLRGGRRGRGDRSR